jgi:hypothetical protein
MSMTAQSVRPVLQDPFAYYKAFLNTGTLTSGNANELAHDDDGYTCHTGIVGAQELDGERGEQVRARGFPHHLAVRFANRSTGARLATIMEQGSYSSLNSRDSLLSLGRFPSLRAVERSSPGRTSHKISRDLDDNSLQRIPENALQEQIENLTPKVHAATSQDYARSHPILIMNTPIKFVPELPQSQGLQISDADQEVSNRKPNGFLRGVLQNVRAASRTRSRSSSSTRTSVFEAREDRPQTSDSSMPHFLLDHHHAKLEDCPKVCRSSNPARTSSSTAVSFSSSDAQARNRKISLPNPQPPASTLSLPPWQKSFLPLHEKISSFEVVPQLPSPLVAVRSREQPTSVRVVTSEPRDEAYVDATTEALTPSNRLNDNTSVQLASDSVPIPSHSASSLSRHDRVMQTSLNASFCSTMSTSYSGTVLGVDLDIQHETSHLARRSSSPMPV